MSDNIASFRNNPELFPFRGPFQIVLNEVGMRPRFPAAVDIEQELFVNVPGGGTITMTDSGTFECGVDNHGMRDGGTFEIPSRGVDIIRRLDGRLLWVNPGMQRPR